MLENTMTTLGKQSEHDGFRFCLAEVQVAKIEGKRFIY